MIIDILVILILLASALVAFLRGFIREVLTILGVGGGFLAAWFGGPILKPYMRNWLGAEDPLDPPKLFDTVPYTMVADILAYGLIFIIVVAVLSFISHMLATTAKNMGLGAVDRTLGVIFGLARGLLFLGLFYLPFHMMTEKETKEEWFKDSRTHFYIEKTAAFIEGFLPETEEEELNPEEEEASSAVREKLKDIQILPSADKTKLQNNQTDPTQGYDENFRENMDQLFEEQTQPPQDYNR